MPRHDWAPQRRRELGGGGGARPARRTRLRRYREPSFRILDTDIKDKTAEKQSRGAQSQRQGLA
jgi:hypothetical protein